MSQPNVWQQERWPIPCLGYSGKLLRITKPFYEYIKQVSKWGGGGEREQVPASQRQATVWVIHGWGDVKRGLGF